MKNKCKKESFVDKDAADKMLAIYNEKFKYKKDFALLTNSYLCFHCGTWHLTSKPNYQTKLKKVELELFNTKKILESREAELFKRIDENKKLKLKSISPNNDIAIENLKLKKELEKHKLLVKEFKTKFENKINDYNKLKMAFMETSQGDLKIGDICEIIRFGHLVFENKLIPNQLSNLPTYIEDETTRWVDIRPELIGKKVIITGVSSDKKSYSTDLFSWASRKQLKLIE